MKRFLYILIAALMMEGAPWALGAAAQNAKSRKARKEKVLSSEGEATSDSTATASKKRKRSSADDSTPYEQRVGTLPMRYLYGVAISYTDSVTYITGISAINDMAYDKITKTPIGLDLYTETLRNYLQSQGKTGYVCSTFLCKSQKEAERQVLSLRHKLQKNEVCPYQPLGGFAYERIATETIFTNAGEHKNTSESDDSDF